MNIETANRLLLALLNKREQIRITFEKELDLASRNAGNMECFRMDMQRLTVGKDNALRYAQEDYERACERANERAAARGEG